MKTIWDYRVTYPYGENVPGYDGFHSGEDRSVTDYRTDVPVTVNGVVIGIVGNTGKSTGIHLHVGKWKDGKSYNPNGRGKTLKEAVVTEIDTKGYTANGKFVRVSAEGFSWVYLHLDSVNVKVGQVLQGDDMFTGRLENKTQTKSAKGWYEKAVHYRKRTIEEKTKNATLAKHKNIAEKTVEELNKALSIKDNEISKLKSQVGDTSKWETLKALVRELVGKA